VQHVEYDPAGRQKFDFLPIPVNSGRDFQTGARDLTLNYYNNPEDVTIPTTPYPFGEKEFDDSPLNRVMKQGYPGGSWHLEGHPVRFDYSTNIQSDYVMLFDYNEQTQQFSTSKYDVLSRPVVEGIYSDQAHASRSAMQTHADDYIHSHSYYETKDNSNYTELHGYTDEAFPPIDSCKILKVYYYDTYDLNADGLPDYEYQQIPPSFADLNYWDNPRGLTTAVKVKILGDRVMPDPWLITVNFYDNRLRVIQQLVKNHYGNYDTISSKYNFAGDLLLSRYAHNGTHVVCDSMVYDHSRRLKETYTRVNGQSEFLAASHEYNELGQLIEKNLHRGQASSPFLQSIDYSYNIRGWLNGINKRDNGNDTGDAFFQELFYDSVASVNEFNCNAQYNGNIAAILWRNSKNGTQKGYGYTYDALNRLTAAAYGERSGGAWNFGKYKVPEISYDYNGNIAKLVRYGFCGQSYTCIDSLNYHYHSPGSNRLIGIIELAERYCGFRAVNTMPAYYYDANGNMNMDKNKGIEAIVYNHLNLPTKIEFENNKRIYYLYDAAGTKLRKYYYEDNRLMTTTDYSGPFVYTGHHPDYILTSEGRLKWDDHDSLFHPEYFIKDHLGNVRGLISSAPNARNPLQVNDYYPFGLEFFSEGSCDNQIKYNSKELQNEADLSWYDYGARFYDPVLGRWHAVDPMAEKSTRWSPYTYALNNPIRFIDPDGMEIVDANGEPITYDKKNGWSSNVTNDVKVIYSALMETKTGRKQWDKAYTSDNKINFSIVEGKLEDDNGNPALGLTGSTFFDRKSAKQVANEGIIPITISLGVINESFEGKNEGLTLRQAIGATAGHEIEHTTKENVKITLQNRNIPRLATKKAVEKKPEEIGRKIREESRQNNFSRIQPIQLGTKGKEELFLTPKI